jgi:transcriptional regulator with XRE-family HTH domain
MLARASLAISTVDNMLIIDRERQMKTGPPKTVSFEQLLAEEQLRDPEFRAEWQRTAPARELAVALLRYRAENDLSQRALAEVLGVSQPRVAKLEAGEHNPSVDTIINVVRRLGIEFAIDIAPSGRKPSLVTARARKGGTNEGDEVTIIAASAR